MNSLRYKRFKNVFLRAIFKKSSNNDNPDTCFILY